MPNLSSDRSHRPERAGLFSCGWNLGGSGTLPERGEHFYRLVFAGKLLRGVHGELQGRSGRGVVAQGVVGHPEVVLDFGDIRYRGRFMPDRRDVGGVIGGVGDFVGLSQCLCAG